MFECIETPLFTKILPRYLDDDDYAKLQNALNAQPEAGNLVPGSGGVRVIYYFRSARGQIWMLTLYAKNVRENIPVHVLRELKEAIDDAKDI